MVGVAHRSKEVRSAKLFYRAAKIVERGSIPVEPLAVRVEGDDVLRNGIDEIAKLLLLLCEQLLGPLAFVDVGPRDVPAHGASAIIAKRGATNEEPAVLAVPSPEAHFGLPGGGAGRSALPRRQEGLDVVRMRETPGQFRGLRILQVFVRQPVVVQEDMIAVDERPVGRSDGDVMRNQIDDLSQLAFLPRDLFLCALAVLDVGARSIPSDDVPLLVGQWRGAHQHPAVHTIRAAHPVFGLERLPRRQCRVPIVHDLRHIFRVQQMRVAPAKVFQRFTDVLQQRSIAEIDLPVGPCAPDHRRDGVDHELELSLRLLDLAESPFQGGPRFLMLSHVHHRTRELEAARFIAQGTSHDVDVPDGAIRHQQSMLEIDVLPRLRRPVDRLLHPGSVFGVNPLEDAFDGRCGRAVVLEDSKGLVRPDDLAGGRLPPEASRMAEPLRFREVRLAPLLGTQVGGEDASGRETRRADGLVGDR